MKEFESLAIRYKEKKLEILDQRLLPHTQQWLVCKSPQDMCGFIEQLSVRGAPLIGVAAALALAQFVEEGATVAQIEKEAKQLKETRPTAVNLRYCLDRTLGAEDFFREAMTLVQEEMRRCEALAEYGASLIQNKEGILTHCNTGGLATTGVGTALGVIRKAYEQGKNIHVFVSETRPLLQGSRLTTWELTHFNIPFTLICDNMVGSLMKRGDIQRVLVGADRIALNGDFANKIGTYSIAVLAKFHNIPFHPVAPLSTIDFSCPTGAQIPIEYREPEEVQGFGDVRWSVSNASAYNPSFDVSPAALWESLILDTGIIPKSMMESCSLDKLVSK